MFPGPQGLRPLPLGEPKFKVLIFERTLDDSSTLRWDRRQRNLLPVLTYMRHYGAN
jgi:hypothetical protein